MSTETLNRVTIPLTVVHGYVQLLRRRIHRRKSPDTNELLQTLTQMEEATQSMRAELQVLHATVMRYRRLDDGP